MSEIRLSPREMRLMEFLLARDWIASKILCLREFGAEKRWPLNARTLITVAMSSAGRKLKRNGGKLKLQKRGGGRKGVEYLITGNRLRGRK